MNRQRILSVIMLFMAVAMLAGCHGDRNIRKHKYLESGRRFSADGKYREAAIQYLNALKVDGEFIDAHYELAQAYEHLGQSTEACAELARTIDLQPDNYKARIDLGNLLFADGRTDQAQAQANAVLTAQPGNPGVHALLSAIALRKGDKDQALAEIHRALDLGRPHAAARSQSTFQKACRSPSTRPCRDEERRARSPTCAAPSRNTEPDLPFSALSARFTPAKTLVPRSRSPCSYKISNATGICAWWGCLSPR